MRLLLVADLHYSLPQFDWVLDIAADFDVVVLAGDHLDLASLVDGRAQSVVVRKYFNRLRAKTKLLTCSGNHDLDGKNHAGEKFAKWLSGAQREGVPSDGESIVLDDTLFTACPWWDGPIVKAGIARSSPRPRPAGRALDLDPPCAAGQVSHQLGRRPLFWRCRATRVDRAVPADMVLSGHVHQSPFVKDGSWVDLIGPTWVFNAGQQFGAPPAHIIIDTDASEALWFSSAGNQLSGSTSRSNGRSPSSRPFPPWLKAADQPRLPGQA